jgi:hypothetical protein
MASSMPQQDFDDFGQYSPRALAHFVVAQNPSELLRLSVASNAIRQYLTDNEFRGLNVTATLARRCHQDPVPGALPQIDRFTTTSLTFTKPDEGSKFNKLLEILQPFNVPDWWNFAVVIAAQHEEATRVKDIIEAAGIYCYLSHGFPAPATRRRLSERHGLVVLVLYRLGAEIDRTPQVMVCLHPPPTDQVMRQALAIGAKSLVILAAIEDTTCLPVCRLMNTLRHFDCGNTFVPQRTVLPAGNQRLITVLPFSSLLLSWSISPPVVTFRFPTYDNFM